MSFSYDINGILNILKGAIDKGASELPKVIDTLKSIEIPSDFNYASYLTSLPGEITDLQGGLNVLGQFLTEVAGYLKKLDTNQLGLSGSNLELLLPTVGNLMSNVSLDDLGGIVNTVTTTFSSIFSYFLNSDVLKEGISLDGITGAISSTGSTQSIIDNTKGTLASMGEKVSNFLKDSLGPVVEKTKAVVSDVWEKVKEVGEDLWEKFQQTQIYQLGKTLAASVTNMALSVLKGFARAVEHLADTLIIVGTAVATIGTSVYDAAQKKKFSESGELADYHSVTAEMWKKSMTFVADNKVESAYKWLYEETKVGKWLDENCDPKYVSTGNYAQIAEFLGEILGFATLSIATGGAGVFVADAIIAGDAMESYWAERKDAEDFGGKEDILNGLKKGAFWFLDKDYIEKNVNRVKEIEKLAEEEGLKEKVHEAVQKAGEFGKAALTALTGMLSGQGSEALTGLMPYAQEFVNTAGKYGKEAASLLADFVKTMSDGKINIDSLVDQINPEGLNVEELLGQLNLQGIDSQNFDASGFIGMLTQAAQGLIGTGATLVQGTPVESIYSAITQSEIFGKIQEFMSNEGAQMATELLNTVLPATATIASQAATSLLGMVTSGSFNLDGLTGILQSGNLDSIASLVNLDSISGLLSGIDTNQLMGVASSLLQGAMQLGTGLLSNVNISSLTSILSLLPV